jgi:hypothetical protein
MKWQSYAHYEIEKGKDKCDNYFPVKRDKISRSKALDMLCELHQPPPKGSKV